MSLSLLKPMDAVSGVVVGGGDFNVRVRSSRSSCFQPSNFPACLPACLPASMPARLFSHFDGAAIHLVARRRRRHPMLARMNFHEPWLRFEGHLHGDGV